LPAHRGPRAGAQGRYSLQQTNIDYRCEDRKRLASWEATLVPLDRSWLPHSENPDHHSQKNEPLSQEMHLKITLSSWGLRLSNSKPGCRISALHFFVK
jgi:hypothetical protein